MYQKWLQLEREQVDLTHYFSFHFHNNNFIYLNQMKSYNSSLRRGVKWYRKLTIELVIGAAIVNSYLLHQKVTNEKNDYNSSLTKLDTLVATNEQSSENNHILVDTENRRSCSSCYEQISKVSVGTGSLVVCEKGWDEYIKSMAAEWLENIFEELGVKASLLYDTPSSSSSSSAVLQKVLFTIGRRRRLFHDCHGNNSSSGGGGGDGGVDTVRQYLLYFPTRSHTHLPNRKCFRAVYDQEHLLIYWVTGCLEYVDDKKVLLLNKHSQINSYPILKLSTEIDGGGKVIIIHYRYNSERVRDLNRTEIENVKLRVKHPYMLILSTERYVRLC
ncbi:hypothetical protein NQ314_005215 [Rhamnusium bicolor]|uniref:Uncharacterized protein n=1 Tax=Rhamnusium bicolor TaxID=1586634 RepID=A0AAV8ZJE6_9CUCU|nr:hypothetical protein NQ314_005215 [Rhamnusium bicolor]